MEKLVKRSRGEEPEVMDAIERARLRRAEVEREYRRAQGQDFVEEEEGEGEEDFEWLRGRTILLIGDSLDRYHLREHDYYLFYKL